MLAGAYYCGWICPFGTLQELASHLGRYLGIRKLKMPKAIHMYLIYVRYLLLALLTLTGLNLLFTLAQYDPRSRLLMLFEGNMLTIGAAAVMLSFVVLSLFFERPFCNYLCMEGAKHGLFSSIRFITVRRKAGTCFDCRKCDKACPMNIEVSTKEHVHSIQCINCFECVAACPAKNTLTYGPVALTPAVRKRYVTIVTIIFILAVSLLGYSAVTGNSLVSLPAKTASIESIDIDADSKDISISDHVSVINDSNDETNNLPTTDQTSNSTDDGGASLKESSEIPDGTYTGTGMGFRGEMTVDVTVKDDTIVGIEVTDHRDDYKWFERAYNGIVSSIPVSLADVIF